MLSRRWGSAATICIGLDVRKRITPFQQNPDSTHRLFSTRRRGGATNG